MKTLNVNTNAVKAFADQLRQMHRSNLPVAIRSALNSAAFDVKQNTMPNSAAATFIQRKPNFFKANSKVEMAKGFDVGSMKATVGFVPKDQAVEDLEQQEEGGTIGGRSFITTKQARAGASWKKSVLPSNRMAVISNRKIINANNVKAKSDKQRFVKAAFVAKKIGGKDAFVLGNVYRGQQTLSRIRTITKNKKKRTLNISRTPLYTYQRKREVKVAGTNFMKRASMESGIKIEKFFIDSAVKQFKKYLSR